PHPADGGWIVHNGMIPHYRDILQEHGLFPNSDCDSEVLGLLVEHADGTLRERCRQSVRTVAESLFRKPNLVFLGLWHLPSQMIVVRQGNPLHWSRCKEGLYIASLAAGLPGKVQEWGNNNLSILSRKGLKYERI